MYNPSKPTILVVDDTPENIDVLKGALTPQYTVRPATNGLAALKLANILPRPDLVLLDIMMPHMDGHEVCRRLKDDPETQDIPIIFVTARAAEADELLGLQMGAVDYIAKPFSVPVVQSRVRTHLALRAATRQLAEQNRILVTERKVIESILLKMRQADSLHAQNLRSIVSPVESTAGDLLLSTMTPDGRQLVLLGDFTGHGLPAAIGGPLVAYILHDMAARNIPAAAVLTTINSELCARLPTGLFFAVALLEIAPDRKSGQAWNAGLPDCLLLRQGRVVVTLPSQLPPLGILNPLEITSAMVPLTFQAGDRLYAFSDGVIEARSTDNELFGLERTQAFLLDVSRDEYPLEQLMHRLLAHTGTPRFEDDITLVEILL
ncbi:MAG: SpoIIE family protein phosphatase [Magnetococcus sp. YQC-3]